MLQSIWDDIRREFDYGNMINKIIIVNVAIYLVVNLAWVFLRIFNGWETPSLYLDLRNFLAISDNGWHLLTHPWSVLTHMFLHEGFWHILWNMLFLYWFGRIFGDLLGDRRVLPLYIFGGLLGALFFVTSAVLLNYGGGYAFGASAAVMAIVVATGLFAPEYNIRLFILGNVRLKYIVLFVILMEIISLGSTSNTGGTFGHLGGIVGGLLFASYLKKGTDLTEPIQRAILWVERKWDHLRTPSKEHRRKGPRAAFRAGKSVNQQQETARRSRPSFMRKASTKTSDARKPSASSPLDDAGISHQEQLDAILDKIKEKGYNSISKEEKDFLFRASNQK